MQTHSEIRGSRTRAPLSVFRSSIVRALRALRVAADRGVFDRAEHAAICAAIERFSALLRQEGGRHE